MIHNVMFAVATLPNNHYLFGGLIEGVKNNVVQWCTGSVTVIFLEYSKWSFRYGQFTFEFDRKWCYWS